ncbi:hypothetical protein C8J25_101848 [Sphingomonas faeni]|uniref:Uncharacterized protein n=1 Tax=Sphingomonas faeni TaxID=185950 RepID=A0A2T5UCW2_9SPHN|nr:hypothetical protein [Sphingomonas faeni]PTW49340.1 hypothetical protein C8J25_101848 [Sphingomonas faeni]
MSNAVYEIENADFSKKPVTYYYRATLKEEQAALDLAAMVGGHFSCLFAGHYLVRFATHNIVKEGGLVEVAPRFEVK